MAISSPLQKAALGLGLALILFALLMDSLGLGSAGFSLGQGLVLLAGFVVMLAGILGKQMLSAYQNLGVVLLNTLLLLFLVEIASGFFLWVISTEPPPATPSQLQIPYYAENDWSATYWQEFLSADKYRYAPYVVWRRPPFSGETIQVDDNNRRITPDADCENVDAFRVFAFGGSTMWGTGAPDWGTIPAYLQKSLAQNLDQPVCVVNFGQSAYVSDQSVVELMLQLKAGARPDWVIFYDGANDVYAAYQNGRAGTHQNLSQLEGIFDQGTENPPLAETLAHYWRDNTYSGRVVMRYFGRDSEELITYATMDKDAQDLAAEVLQNYLANIALVEEWAAFYGFEARFFWQPIISEGDKTLTAREQAILDYLDPALVALYRATYAQIESPPINLAGVFDNFEGDLWTDLFHLTPEGNQIIAEAMLLAMP